MYAANGCTSLCLGRTEPENSGLLQFKRGWGGSEGIISYCKYNIRKSSFSQQPSMLSGTHTLIFRNLPVPVLRLAGNLLYKHVG